MRVCRNTFVVKGLALALLLAVVIPVVQPVVANAQTPPPTTASSIVGDIADGALSALLVPLRGIIYYFTVTIGSGAAYITGYFFNFAANLTLASQAYSLGFIGDMWKTVLSLANLTFLFILIFIGLSVMFRAETSGTMHTLAAVVAVALLVNFSFFFTRVVIDAGNILAWQFYSHIQANPVASSGSTAKDLSAVIMNGTNIQNILGVDAFRKSIVESQINAATIFVLLTTTYVSVGIMLFILAAMFLSAAVKLIMRTVVLWFLIIASPLAFVAAALPGKPRGYAKDWLTMLVSNTFYPAAFLFMFMVIAWFVQGMAAGTQALGLGTIAGTTAEQQQLYAYNMIATVVVKLGILAAMFYIALRASDIISSKSGSFVNNMAGKVTGKYWGAVRGGYSFAARRTGGFLYQQGVSKQFQRSAEMLKGERWANTKYGSVVRRLEERVAKTGFGGVRPYTEVVERKNKFEEENRKNLKNIGARETAQQLGEINKTWGADKQTLENLRTTDTNFRVHGVGTGLDPAQKAEKDRLEALNTERETLAKKVEGFSDSQITSLKAADVEGIIGDITKEHLKALEKSTDHTTDAIEQMTKSFHDLNKRAPLGEAKKQLEAIGKISDKLDSMGVRDSRFTDVARPPAGHEVVMTPQVAEDMKKAVEEMKATWERTRDTATRGTAPFAEANQKVSDLNKALTKLDPFIEKVKEVPEGAGDTPGVASFKHKRP